MNKIFEFENGDEVQDVVTRFKGIVMVRSEYSTGCITYGLQSSKMKEGAPDKWIHLDGKQLKLVKAGKVQFKSASAAPGGPLHQSHFPPVGPRL